MADIRFRLLGGTAVTRDGVQLPVGARMQRALLALLAVNAGRVVSVDRLIDSLWGDDPPSAATATLHAYVSQLRRLLEPDRPARAPASVVVTRDPGYLLALPAEQVDVLRFEQLVRGGRHALEAGDAAQADRLLSEADELWQGEPLTEFSAEVWAIPIAARLAEAHATGAEDRVDAWLALGRHVAAVTELGRLVEEAPMRERRWAQLMLALYRSHRQADALRAYQRCRTVLADELGIDPGPEMRSLEQAVLAQDPSLDVAVAARPLPPATGIGDAAPPEGSTETLVARTAHLRRIAQRLEQAFSIVDPADVRWVFISHADRDHIGNLGAVLEACRQATVVTTSIGIVYMLADGPPPLDRVRWVNDGETFDVGDRRLAALRPPLWDAAQTRGLYDPKSGVYWAADAFGSMLTHPVTDASQLDPVFWEESLLFENRAHTEWHALVDPVKFDAHVERSASLLPTVVASAHGPVLTGEYIQRGFELTRRTARLSSVPPMGQPVLDPIIAGIAAAAA